MINNLKQNIGETTEKLEAKAGEYYFALESWQRGTLAIALVILLIFVIYWLAKEDSNKLARKEAQLEEKWLKQMVLLKKLKE